MEKLGSRIRYKANVTEILLNNGKAVGVKLSNGEKFTQILLYLIPRWDTFGLKNKSKGLIPSENVPKSEYKWSDTIKLPLLLSQFT